MVAQSIDKQFCELLKDHPEAISFGKQYAEYCHALDDLIDESCKPSEILKVAHLAQMVYSADYYQTNKSWLLPLMIVIHSDYADSVDWESDEAEWKRKYADVLRATGNNLAIMMVQIYCGYEKAREFAKLVREASYNDHHSITGDPI